MFSNDNGDLARLRQVDLIAEAQYQSLVNEAISARTSQPRHLVAAVLRAVADRMEPLRISLVQEPASVRPELPCAVSPC
jgi:hypothetical protein